MSAKETKLSLSLTQALIPTSTHLPHLMLRNDDRGAHAFSREVWTELMLSPCGWTARFFRH